MTTETDVQAGDPLAEETDVTVVQKPAPAEGQEAKASPEDNSDDDEAAPKGDGEKDKADEGEDDARPKKESGLKRLKREVERLRNELAARGERAPSADPQALDAEVRKIIGDPPKEDEFPNDYLAYERALTAYEVDKRQAKREVEARYSTAEASQRERLADLIEDHNERIQAAKAALPDWDAVMSRPPVAVLRQDLVPYVLDSEQSALLQYHLTANPRDTERLNRLPPIEAARELGRIEARLSLPKPNRATQAPTPVTAPRGTVSPTPRIRTQSDYEKWRNGG